MEPMIYKITFEFDKKTYEILANEIDLESHPYLLVAEQLEFEDQTGIIISANGDESRKRFGDVDRLHIPMQSVKLIEELASKEKVTALKVADHP
jgi:hypothetical protein